MGMFDEDDDKFGISHSSVRESMHSGLSKNEHESIHDHNKIHESMHLGKDNVISPLSGLDDDD